MYVIGLCGTTGSGKSLVSNFFKERGIPCINADEVYKELLYPNSPLIRKLSSEFGAEIITKSGELDRKKLASIVDILPRKSQLIRPAVANADQALVVFATKDPEPNRNLLDRFLILMAKQKLPVIICFNCIITG